MENFKLHLKNRLRRFTQRLLSRAEDPSGFTLIEVMIAMVLLVFISVSIYQTTTQVFRRREILQNEGEFYNSIRLAMNLLDRDVSLTYSPTILLPKLQDTTADPNSPDAPQVPDEDAQSLLSSDLGRSTRFWNAAVDVSGVRPSRFIGLESSMSFVSASHVRIYKNAPESEFIKVSYELKEDPFREVEDTDARVLVRTVNPSAFDDNDDRLIRDERSRIKTYPLLPGVKSLKFRYYRRDLERWDNSWDSDSADHKNRIPDLVEVRIEVVGTQRLQFSGIYQMKTEIPLDGLPGTF